MFRGKGPLVIRPKYTRILMHDILKDRNKRILLSLANISFFQRLTTKEANEELYLLVAERLQDSLVEHRHSE